MARARFAAVAAEVEERWNNLLRGPAALTHEQVLALAGELYREEIAAHQADPGGARAWAAAELLDRYLATARKREGGKPDGHRLATDRSLAETLAGDRHGARRRPARPAWAPPKARHPVPDRDA